MTVDALIKLVQSYGRDADAERESLAECLSGLISKLAIEDQPGLRNFQTTNKLKAYLSQLES